jgi:hypothetical protein
MDNNAKELQKTIEIKKQKIMDLQKAQMQQQGVQKQ